VNCGVFDRAVSREPLAVEASRERLIRAARELN